MAHIYHVSEWQSPTGRWHCNDVEDLGMVQDIGGYHVAF